MKPWWRYDLDKVEQSSTRLGSLPKAGHRTRPAASPSMRAPARSAMAHKLPPPITRDERGVAREIRAMADCGKTTSEILKRWPTFDAHFVERALSDSTIKDEVWEAGRSRREAESWIQRNPPALSTTRHPLPRANVTLCQAVTWLAMGRAWRKKQLRAARFHPDRIAHLVLREQFNKATQLIVDASVDRLMPIFGYPVDGGEIQEIPFTLLLSRPLKVIMEDDKIIAGGTTYEGVTMRRSDLLRLWPTSTPATVGPNKGEAAEAPGTTTSGVRLKAEGAAKRTSLKTDIEADYADRVNEHRSRTGRRPTFEADNKWRESKGLTYGRLRELREQHCTEEERKGGRPPRS